MLVLVAGVDVVLLSLWLMIDVFSLALYGWIDSDSLDMTGSY